MAITVLQTWSTPTLAYDFLLIKLIFSDRLWILLPDCALVCGTEILIDWLKHAFITRFNDIPADAYRDYTVLLASDLIMCKQKYVCIIDLSLIFMEQY